MHIEEIGISTAIMAGLYAIAEAIKASKNAKKSNGNGNGNGTSRRRINELQDKNDELEQKVWRTELNALETKTMQAIAQIQSDVKSQQETIEGMVKALAKIEGAFSTFRVLAETWQATRAAAAPISIVPPIIGDTNQP